MWDAFFLHALLRHHSEKSPKSVLRLTNKGSNADRLKPALEERNLAMVGPGQEHWNHACDLCCATEENVNGTTRRCQSLPSRDDLNQGFKTGWMRAAVTDGVTVGRPCCGHHDCQGDLPSQRARFCSAHENLNNICSVVACEARAPTGFRTCEDPEHRALEDLNLESKSAMFQLRKRLQKHNMAHLPDSTSDPEASLLPEMDLEDAPAWHCSSQPLFSTQTECNPRAMPTAVPAAHSLSSAVSVASVDAAPSAAATSASTSSLAPNVVGTSAVRPPPLLQPPSVGSSTPSGPKAKIKARLGRSWTHNEQLCVATCGVILGRATFYGSEAVNGTRVSRNPAICREFRN